MTNEELITYLETSIGELQRIRGRFIERRINYDIHRDDDPILRRISQERWAQ
ncbi:hypothetical protein NK8_61910 (plasmid) [Caballeronia sp. NK8]|uniref:hypothetical protein n=1 Tax=Caballeronia sp. NK8 TaxID=140098 RepID=UPI001BB5FEE3|nr:hypothetical protein [Caballeronia sp. NK8]BCQ28002.1 hypothetical protein NK8_61910 [Caballeronia sp. NK8]